MRRKIALVTILVALGFSSANAEHSRYFKYGDTALSPSTLAVIKRQTHSSGSRVDRIRRKIEERYKFPKPVSVTGNISFGDILSIISQQGIKIKSVGDIPLSKVIPISMQTDSIPEFLNTVCKAADVWCDYDPVSRTLSLQATKVFTFDFFPEGKVTVSIGGSSRGSSRGDSEGGDSTGEGSSSNGGSSTSASFTYSNSNINGFAFVEMLQEFFGKDAKVLPSQNGYITVALTPSQWEFLNTYFNQNKSRKQVVDVEITLLRVDLNKDFQWGIDWDSLLYRSGKIHSLSFGFNAGTIIEGERAFFQIATKSDPQTALMTALSKYGKVYKVDSWHTQGLTGSLIPFGNYQEVKYFVIGSTSTNSGTETTAEDRTVEVGFLGSLTIYKNTDGCYVDGAINLSGISDWVTMQVNDWELRAPEIVGKRFRIATRLSTLDKTLVIGGFRISGYQSTKKAIPILHQIPVLGWLFKGKEDLRQNSEFVVLITLRKGREGLTPEVERRIREINSKVNF